jgi:beta-mannosidase
MAAKRVISLAESPPGGAVWTVRALHIDAIQLPPMYDKPDCRAALGRGVSARVPGCVHHALVDAKLIESPDVGDAEERLQWIGATEWEYRCEFEWADAQAAASVGEQNTNQHTELVLDGLDTVAEVLLNGQVVGRSESFFFPHRFAIDQAIRAGRNELLIRFTPPLVHIRKEEARLGARPYNGDEVTGEGVRGKWDPFVFMRKPACNFGWDWGPRVATVGIAGGVRIERWETARIGHVRPLVVRADAEVAEVRVHVDAVMRELVAGGEEPHIVATLRAPGDGGTIVAQGRGVFTPDDRSHTSVLLGITKPELWWPRGYGPQAQGGAEEERPLYELRVELWNGSALLDTRTMRVGLRTVELDTSPDQWGSAFSLRVNGQPVFCMGANWIPEGLFAGYAGENIIRERVRDAAEMNANMLRVWGGGLYEPECFYEECDRRGILVWQDFMFSCGMYPEEAPYGGENGLVAREARYQLARLSSHASVVLWCGGNETIWGHDKWGWRERLKEEVREKTWGMGYWLELLPRLCAEVDPSRPYWPNSPWSGVAADGAQRDVLDADHGDRHTWEVDAWGPRPETEGFRAPNESGVPRFCSEFGHQSSSCFATIIEALYDFPELARRQRGPGGDARWYDKPLTAVFGPQGSSLREAGQGGEVYHQNFPRRHYLVQMLQARVVSRGIEWHRVNRPRCGGVLFWQLNDCWAGHSWSAIDAAGKRKPLWYAAKRAMSPRLLSIHVVDGAPVLYAANDTDEAWEGEVVTRRIAFDGTTLAEHRGHVRIGPRVSGVIADLVAKLGPAADPKRELLAAESEGVDRAVYFHLPDRELEYPRADGLEAIHMQVPAPADDGVLHIRAHLLIRDLVIGLDDFGHHQPLASNILTLLPGEEATVEKHDAYVRARRWPEFRMGVQWVNQG